MILPERVLGTASVNTSSFGRANLPIRSATCAASSGAHRRLVAAGGLVVERDERGDGLAGQLVGHADDRGLCDGRVLHERALDLRRRESVSGDVHHVVDAAEPQMLPRRRAWRHPPTK